MIVLSRLATLLSLSLSFLSLPLTKEVSMCEPDYVVRQLINLRYIKLRYRGRETFYLLSLSLPLSLSLSPSIFLFSFVFFRSADLTCPRSVAHFSNIDSFFLLILFSRSSRSATFLPPDSRECIFFFYSVVIAPPSFALVFSVAYLSPLDKFTIIAQGTGEVCRGRPSAIRFRRYCLSFTARRAG